MDSYGASQRCVGFVPSQSSHQVTAPRSTSQVRSQLSRLWQPPSFVCVRVSEPFSVSSSWGGKASGHVGAGPERLHFEERSTLFLEPEKILLSILKKINKFYLRCGAEKRSDREESKGEQKIHNFTAEHARLVFQREQEEISHLR